MYKELKHINIATRYVFFFNQIILRSIHLNFHNRLVVINVTVFFAVFLYLVAISNSELNVLL